ncbi:MAG: LysR family transcriptional regulator [Paracoccus sp. (in: a-proteobacteria)]|nr:LysR family transcriptional regulator [Paracoccus sp. (in: a-proteobacteria)]
MRRNWGSLREYEALRAMISTGSTTAAAAYLGVTQPAVSRALAQLEARRGVILFERRAGRLYPTAEALRINSQLDGLFEAMNALDGAAPAEGPVPLRIAAPPSMAHGFLTGLLAEFMARHPGQPVQLGVATSRELVAQVAGHETDIGFTTAQLTHSGIERIPFHQSHAVCIIPRRHHLAHYRTILPEHLDGVDFIAVSRGHMVRGQLDRLLAAGGYRPSRVAEVSTGAAALDLARRGMGVTVICPFPIVPESDAQIVMRPFRPEILYQSSFMVSATRPLAAPARAFMRLVREHIQGVTAKA